MTLTEAAYWTKKSGILAISGIVLILILWQFIELISPKAKIPEKYLVPNNQCGELPYLRISSIGVDIDYSNIEIETATGKYPELPKVVNVYKYSYRGGMLSAKESSQNLAKLFGFDPNTIKRKSSTQYEFTNNKNNRTLVVETSNLNFDITSSVKNTNLSGEIPDSQSAITMAENMLYQQRLLPEGNNSKLALVRYLILDSNGQITQTPSRLEANLVRIDIFQQMELIAVEKEYIKSKEIGEYLIENLPNSPTKRINTKDGEKIVYSFSVPLVTERPYSSNIYIISDGSKLNGSELEDLYSMHYINWDIDPNACGTYSLIGEDIAIEKIKSGEGYLVDLQLKGTQSLDPLPADLKVNALRIYDMSIAYFDITDLIEDDYLQPIYVIRGEAETNYGTGEFMIYVPAVKR